MFSHYIPLHDIFHRHRKKDFNTFNSFLLFPFSFLVKKQYLIELQLSIEFEIFLKTNTVFKYKKTVFKQNLEHNILRVKNKNITMPETSFQSENNGLTIDIV